VLTLSCGVDTSLFRPVPRSWAPSDDVATPRSSGASIVSQRGQLRQQRAWSQRFVYLAVGAMTGNKGVQDLVTAFQRVWAAWQRRQRRGDTTLDPPGGRATHAQLEAKPLLVLHGMDALYPCVRVCARACVCVCV